MERLTRNSRLPQTAVSLQFTDLQSEAGSHKHRSLSYIFVVNLEQLSIKEIHLLIDSQENKRHDLFIIFLHLELFLCGPPNHKDNCAFFLEKELLNSTSCVLSADFVIRTLLLAFTLFSEAVYSATVCSAPTMCWTATPDPEYH